MNIVIVGDVQLLENENEEDFNTAFLYWLEGNGWKFNGGIDVMEEEL